MSRNFAVVACSCLVLSFVPQDAPQTQSAPQAQTASAPWVLHAPFEGRPRMILVALGSGIFVAYDAETCGFHSAWSGGVSLDPSTAGRSVGPTARREGAVQSEGSDGVPWELREGDVLVPTTVRYRGCTFDDDHVSLQFEIQPREGAPIRVKETPRVLNPTEMDELWQAMTGDPTATQPADCGPVQVVLRHFVVENAPRGASLALRHLRTVAGITSDAGFDSKRDPRQGQFTTENDILVEPLLLTFEDGREATTLEWFEVR